jgi:hypothetical protein
MNDEDSFYNEVCKQTLSENRYGTVMEKGFVSESGFGDGCYPVSGSFTDGELTRIRVEFLGEDESYDEEEEYSYDDYTDNNLDDEE